MKCKKHKNYQVKKQPRSRCFDCWEMWKNHLVDERDEREGEVDYHMCMIEEIQEDIEEAIRILENIDPDYDPDPNDLDG